MWRMRRGAMNATNATMAGGQRQIMKQPLAHAVLFSATAGL
jgi:hypothetical protein